MVTVGWRHPGGGLELGQEICKLVAPVLPLQPLPHPTLSILTCLLQIVTPWGLEVGLDRMPDGWTNWVYFENHKEAPGMGGRQAS